MQRHTLLGASALAFAAALAVAPAARAADAAHPYRNIDKSVDAGNDTGDSRVDALNAAQLDSNQPPATGQPLTAPMAPQPMTGTTMSPAHPPMTAAPGGQ